MGKNTATGSGIPGDLAHDPLQRRLHDDRHRVRLGDTAAFRRRETVVSSRYDGQVDVRRGTRPASRTCRSPPARPAWSRRHPAARRAATSPAVRAGAAGTPARGSRRHPATWPSAPPTWLRPSGHRRRAALPLRSVLAAAANAASSVAGGLATRLPRTRQGCSNRATLMSWRGSAAASASRSRVSMPRPAPWLSSRVATGVPRTVGDQAAVAVRSRHHALGRQGEAAGAASLRWRRPPAAAGPSARGRCCGRC